MAKRKHPLTKLRKDSWENPYMGYGIVGRDKVVSTTVADSFSQLDWNQLAVLYNTNDLASRIVDLIPDEMFRAGYDVQGHKRPEEAEEEKPETEDTEAKKPPFGKASGKPGDKPKALPLKKDKMDAPPGKKPVEVEEEPEEAEEDEDPEDPEEETGEEEELDVDTPIQNAIRWGRLFGGCIVVLGANDNRPLSEPLEEAAVVSFNYMNVIDRRYVTITKYYEDPEQPKFGQPMTYMVGTMNSTTASAPVEIHETRILRFDGSPIDPYTLRRRSGWGLSVLERAHIALRDLGTSFSSAANLMADASQSVFKLTGLYDMIAGGEKEALQTRMQLVDMSRSSARSVLIDKENEDFTRQATSFQGLPEMIDRFERKVSAACGIPITILMGRSAAGMNASGDGDSRIFYDMIANQQKRVLGPALKKVYRLLAVVKGQDPSKVKVKFRKLWEPSAKEQAEIDKINAERDKIYIDAGVWTEEEVAISRAEGVTTTVGTEIDTSMRQASLETAVDELINGDPNAGLIDPLTGLPQAGPAPEEAEGQAPPGGLPPAPPQAGGKAPLPKPGKAPRKPKI